MRDRRSFVAVTLLIGLVLFMNWVWPGLVLMRKTDTYQHGLLDQGYGHCAPGLGRDPYRVHVHGRLVFLAIGDWGLDLDETHEDGKREDWDLHSLLSMSRAMNRKAKDTDFVLNLGDNFYQYGIDSVEDERWRSTFEDVFQGPHLHNLLWYSMLGNHDWRANYVKSAMGTRSQLERTFHKSNKRWCMPWYNYTLHVEGTNGKLARIVVFDSQVLFRFDPDESTGAFDVAGVPNKEHLLEWLKKELCESRLQNRDEWLITASHHFFSTVGNYLPVNDQLPGIMRERVLPILEECGVDMHFHGHDHVTQVLSVPRSRLVQIGVGSAGKLNGVVRGGQNELDSTFGKNRFKVHFSSPSHAFARVVLRPKIAHIQLLDEHGRSLYNYTMTRHWGV